MIDRWGGDRMRRSGPASEDLIGPSWALPGGSREPNPSGADPTLVAAAAVLGGLAVLAVTHQGLLREWGVVVTVGSALAALVLPAVPAGLVVLVTPRHRIGNVAVALFALAALVVMVGALAVIDV